MPLKGTFKKGLYGLVKGFPVCGCQCTEKGRFGKIRVVLFVCGGIWFCGGLTVLNKLYTMTKKA